MNRAASFRAVLVLLLCAGFASGESAAGDPDPAPGKSPPKPGEPAASGASLAGEKSELNGAKLTELKVTTSNPATIRLAWTADGSHALVLDGKSRTIRSISIPDLSEDRVLCLSQSPSEMAISSEGALLSCPAENLVVVVDAASLEQTGIISAYDPRKLAASPGSPIAFAITGNSVLYELDVKTRTVLKEFSQGTEVRPKDPKGGTKLPFSNVGSVAMPPDGSSVFVAAPLQGLFKLDVAKNGDLAPSGQVGSMGSEAELLVSDDSRYLAFWTSDASMANPPPGGFKSPFVYKTDGLIHPIFGLSVPCRNFAFDRVKRSCYVSGPGGTGPAQIIKSFNSEGTKAAEFDFKEPVIAFIAHPSGGKLLVRTLSKLYWMELP